MGKSDEVNVTAYATEVEDHASSSKLEVRYSDKRAREGQIIDVATSRPLYTVEHRYRKPTFTLKSALDGRILATACSSKWTYRMEMDVQGQEFELKPKSKLGCTCTYPSPAFHGQTLTWLHQRDGGYLKYVCIDESDQPIARYRGPSIIKGCSMEGLFGDFEFVDGRIQSEAQRDEIVATGLTLAYKDVMNRSAAATTVVVV